MPTTAARNIAYGDQVTYTDTGITTTFTAAAVTNDPGRNTTHITVAGRPDQVIKLPSTTPVTVLHATLPPEPTTPGTIKTFTTNNPPDGTTITAVRTFNPKKPWMLDDHKNTTLTWADLIVLHGPTNH